MKIKIELECENREDMSNLLNEISRRVNYKEYYYNDELERYLNEIRTSKSKINDIKFEY